MRVAYVLRGLLWFALCATSCADCRQRPPDTVLRVRWPASLGKASRTPKQPATRSSERTSGDAGETRRDDDERAPLLDAETPGVQIREGRAADLTYLEAILGDAEFDDALPLVVLLHGRGDRPRLPGGPFGSVSTPMRLIMPQAPMPLGDGFSWLSISITQNRPDLLARSLRQRTDHLAALINDLRTSLPTLGRPIVTGFSQGGMLSFTLALLRPDAVGTAFPLAGWVPPGLMPSTPIEAHLRVPIRALHGAADPIVPIEPTRQVVSRLSELGWETDFVSYEGVEHVVSDAMNEQFEAWLEEALRVQAPELVGRGLGSDGPEVAPYEPYEPLDPQTQEAIAAFDRTPVREDVSLEDTQKAVDASAGDARPTDKPALDGGLAL